MKLYRTSLLAALSAVAMAGLCSCMDNVNTTENAEMKAQPQAVDVKRIVTDPYLEKRLQILRVDTSLNDSGLLQVQVTARNTRTGFWSWLEHGDNPYHLAYKFVWLDSKGIEVKSPANGAYLQRDVLPGDLVRFSGLAPSPDCKDFQLSIKETTSP